MSKVPFEWKKYEYFDPKVVLPRLQEVRKLVTKSNLPDTVKNLRTNKLRPEREAWDAAVLCALLSSIMGLDMYFSKVESSDYDSVFRWNEGDIQHFAPVQMKELVPEINNPNGNLQSIINSLEKKYTDSSDLIIGIKINRKTRIDFSALNIPALNVGEIYFFGATNEEQTKWTLIGDILGKCGRWKFEFENA